jgi:hypothetical protein
MNNLRRNPMNEMEKLDSICMLLIAIGESVKKLDKITAGELFVSYPDIDRKGAKLCLA